MGALTGERAPPPRAGGRNPGADRPRPDQPGHRRAPVLRPAGRTRGTQGPRQEPRSPVQLAPPAPQGTRDPPASGGRPEQQRDPPADRRGPARDRRAPHRRQDRPGPPHREQRPSPPARGRDPHRPPGRRLQQRHRPTAPRGQGRRGPHPPGQRHPGRRRPPTRRTARHPRPVAPIRPAGRGRPHGLDRAARQRQPYPGPALWAPTTAPPPSHSNCVPAAPRRARSRPSATSRTASPRPAWRTSPAARPCA